ncbi:MAG: LytTR family DNA-binding domain-containing protein [Bacteroidales bacterium]|nr:LytTR family DNA-binding domain-containing protein [Bacteroidales bacterium]
MLRTIIIDDEVHVRDTLVSMLNDYCPQVKIVGEANSVESGFRTIRNKIPDLILLDIKMDDGTGFDLLQRFDSIKFKIIFITAYEKHAIEAFKFSAVDYLMKPVNPEKLAEAIVRAEKLVQQTFVKQLDALKENMNPLNTQNKKIVVKTLDNIYLLNTRDIIHCQSDDCYTVIESAGEEKVVVSKVLKEYDELLTNHGFFRVHRSHLVNLQHIKRFEKQEGGYVVMSNDQKIPVSSRARERLLELFANIAEN